MLQFPLIKFTRKSVRQTLWTGLTLLVLAVAWLPLSGYSTPYLFTNDDLRIWLILLPSVMLLIAAIGFLVAWAQYIFYSWVGLYGPDDED